MEMFKDLSKHSDTPTELVKLPIVFILDILQIENIPDSIKNGESVRIDWRRGTGFKSTAIALVHNSSAVVNSEPVSLATNMDCLMPDKVFQSKVTQIQLVHVDSGKIVAETDFDLADWVDFKLD